MKTRMSFVKLRELRDEGPVRSGIRSSTLQSSIEHRLQVEDRGSVDGLQALHLKPAAADAQNSGTVVSTEAVAGAEYTPAGWILDLARVSPA